MITDLLYAMAIEVVFTIQVNFKKIPSSIFLCQLLVVTNSSFSSHNFFIVNAPQFPTSWRAGIITDPHVFPLLIVQL